MTKALLKEGRKRIAFVMNETEKSWHTDQQKLAGYRRSMEESDVGFDSKYILTDSMSNANIVSFLNKIEPDGIICPRVTHAFAIMGEILKMEKKIPQDIRLARFGESEDLPNYKDYMYVVVFPEEALIDKIISVLCESIKKTNHPVQRIYLNQDIIINE